MVILNEGRPMLAASGGRVNQFAEILEWGHALAETDIGIPKGGSLWEAKGWKQYVAHMPDHKRATTAIMLENCRDYFGPGRMNESTRTSSLGTFDKWIFPVISNMSENDVIDQLVALQPMAGPVSQIVYIDIVTGKAKGQTPAGTPFWNALRGPSDRWDDSEELVSNESIGTVSGSNLTVTLAWTPVRAGTIQITLNGAVLVTDDGNGNLISGGVTNVGTINYVTGVVTLTGATNGVATATYAYNSEGNAGILDYEMRLSSSPVTARAIKLSTFWTEEADQNLQSMYNIKAESILINALTNALQYQKHRSVIADLRSRADAGVVTWDANAPSGVNYQTHKFSIIDAFQTASNFIFGATNMVTGNWALLGLQAATVVQTLPQFVSKNSKTQMQGVTYIGDLGNFKIFADPHYPNNEFLIGHKGDQFLTTGYVLAEYQKLYTTPDVVLQDFTHRRAFATSFAKKLVNSKMYARGAILNSPTNFGAVIG